MPCESGHESDEGADSKRQLEACRIQERQQSANQACPSGDFTKRLCTKLMTNHHGRSTHGIAAKDASKRNEGKRDTLFGEPGTQLVERATDALLGSVFTGAKGFANGAKVALFKVTEHNGVAIGLFKLIHRFIEDRCDLFPVRVERLMECVHFGGDLLAGLSAGLTSHDRAGDKASMPMQPTAKHRVGRERTAFAGEIS